MNDNEINRRFDFQTRFAGRVDNQEVILRRDGEILQDAVAGGKLFFGHNVVGVPDAPNGDGVEPTLTDLCFQFLHLRNAAYIAQTDFACVQPRDKIIQVAVFYNFVMRIMDKLLAVKRHCVDRSFEATFYLLGGCGQSNHFCLAVADGIFQAMKGNRGEVGLFLEILIDVQSHEPMNSA